jgi:hypothetical protein
VCAFWNHDVPVRWWKEMVERMGGRVFIIGKRAEVLIGQQSCLDLVRDLAPHNEIISTRMSPVERSQLAASL